MCQLKILSYKLSIIYTTGQISALTVISKFNINAKHIDL